MLGINRENNKRMVENIFLMISKNQPPIRGFRSLNLNLLVQPGSVEEQIVADRIEEGKSLSSTTEFVNLYCRQHQKTEVGQYCVYRASQRIHPLITSIAPKKQGSHDVSSPWCKARN